MSQAKTALITGASAGLGKEFARQLAASGHNLILVARRLEKLEEIASQIRDSQGVEVHCLRADLADPGAPQALYDEIAGLGLSVDFLVNNAGDAGPDLFAERDWSKQQANFQLMLLAIAHLCHLFVPDMAARGFGRVINVSSVAARIPRVSGCNYGPIKAYLVALSEEMNLTFADSGVKVCALCPGYTHTDFHETANLMDMKNSMPAWLWYDADGVIKDGLEAVEKGKSVYLSGRLYRWVDPFFQSVFTRRLFRVRGRE